MKDFIKDLRVGDRVYFDNGEIREERRIVTHEESMSLDFDKETPWCTLGAVQQFPKHYWAVAHLKYEEYRVGDAVVLTGQYLNLAYLRKRCEYGYLLLEKGLKAKVVGRTSTGDKLAIQFERPIWRNRLDNDQPSSFNNGCHGKGAVDYCIYIPANFLTRYVDPMDMPYEISDDELLLLG